MRINGSALALWLKCPMKYHYSYARKRAIPQTDNMRIGLAFHEAFATGKLDPVLAKREPWMRKALIDLQAAIDDMGIKIHHQELPLATPLLFGRLDALAEWNGQLWHLQLKTVGSSISTDAYLDSLGSGYAEAIYRALVTANYPDYPYGGSIIALIKKPQKKSGDAKVFLRPLTQPAGQYEMILEELRIHSFAMTDGWVYQNRTACFDNNSLCPYRKVCDGRTPLEEAFGELDPLSEYDLGNASFAPRPLPPPPSQRPHSPNVGHNP